jgi:NHL repeat
VARAIDHFVAQMSGKKQLGSRSFGLNSIQRSPLRRNIVVKLKHSLPRVKLLGIGLIIVNAFLLTGCGGGTSSTSGASGVATTFAGNCVPSGFSICGWGEVDAIGAAARFNFSYRITADITGNLYVTDQLVDTICKITPAVVVTTFAGTAMIAGSSDGIEAAASFHYPSGITADSADNLYITDQGNQLIRKITPAGAVTTLAGSCVLSGGQCLGGYDDGVGPAALFRNPDGITSDSMGNLYAADTYSQAIRKIQ